MGSGGVEGAGTPALSCEKDLFFSQPFNGPGAETIREILLTTIHRRRIENHNLHAFTSPPRVPLLRAYEKSLLTDFHTTPM